MNLFRMDCHSRFSTFGGDIYRSEIVRSCIRPIAEETSKLSVIVHRRANDEIVRSDVNDRLQRLIEYQPNPYMNGKDFLYKVRTLYELHNNAFIWIARDTNNSVSALFPIPFTAIEFVERDGEPWFRFGFRQGETLEAPWGDVIILRQDYAEDLVFGSSNWHALQQATELIHTTNEGIMNAVKSGGNVKGLLKSTKGILDSDDVKKMRDDFIRDYVSLENASGIAALDSTMDYIPLSGADNVIINSAQMKELRENIYRYFGINDKIIMSQYSESDWEAFYSRKIEPFALALSLEATNKIFTERERGFGNEIVFAGNRMLYTSSATKLSFAALVDRALITDAEYREDVLGFSAEPTKGTMRIRKEYAEADRLNEIQGVGESGGGTDVKQ